LAKECYSMKLELLMNATVVDEYFPCASAFSAFKSEYDKYCCSIQLSYLILYN
jgi:hypothetical protein